MWDKNFIISCNATLNICCAKKTKVALSVFSSSYFFLIANDCAEFVLCLGSKERYRLHSVCALPCYEHIRVDLIPKRVIKWNFLQLTKKTSSRINLLIMKMLYVGNNSKMMKIFQGKNIFFGERIAYWYTFMMEIVIEWMLWMFVAINGVLMSGILTAWEGRVARRTFINFL